MPGWFRSDLAILAGHGGGVMRFCWLGSDVERPGVQPFGGKPPGSVSAGVGSGESRPFEIVLTPGFVGHDRDGVGQVEASVVGRHW